MHFSDIVRQTPSSIRWVPLAAEWAALVALVWVADQQGRRKPFEHNIELWLHDPSLQYPMVVDETVPGTLNDYLTFYFPALFITFVSIAKLSVRDVHHGLLSFLSGYYVVLLFTNFGKNRVGRIRPDFMDRCKYDLINQVCTGDPGVIEEGRRSFPSGHSSSAFFGCVYLFMFLAGKLRTFVLDEYSDYSFRSLSVWNVNISSMRLIRFCITISPLFLSTYVAISRWEDHWHHPTDIIAGSLIGILGGVITYIIWWPNPFDSKAYDRMGSARNIFEVTDPAFETYESLGTNEDLESGTGQEPNNIV